MKILIRGVGEREREKKKQKTLQISAETQVPMPPSGNKKKHSDKRGEKKKIHLNTKTTKDQSITKA